MVTVKTIHHHMDEYGDCSDVTTDKYGDCCGVTVLFGVVIVMT